MTVVLGPGWPGVMLHEAVGHGLEGDFNRKKTSAFAGLIGQRVASPGVTVVDDGTMPDRRGSLTVDDEGTPSNTHRADRGRHPQRLHAGPAQRAADGHARRPATAGARAIAHAPMPRMTNTYMLAGDKDPQEIIASVKRGLYAVNFGGGQVDITSGKFVFSASEAYLIEDGKVGPAVKGATLIGNGPDALTKVAMIGNDLKLDDGIGTCGKDGQGVPVGVGQPTLRMDGLTVGGTACMRSSPVARPGARLLAVRPTLPAGRQLLSVRDWSRDLAPAVACDLATAPTTRWTIAREHGVAWLVTPCGERFFAIGVNVRRCRRLGRRRARPAALRLAPLRAVARRPGSTRRGRGSTTGASTRPAPGRCRRRNCGCRASINLELGRYARFHWFDPFDPATEAAHVERGGAADRALSRLALSHRLFLRQRGRLVGRRAVPLLLAEAGRRTTPSSAGWRCCASTIAATGARFTADFVPPPGVASWAALLRAETTTRLRPGGDGMRGGAALDRQRRRHYYALAARGDPQAPIPTRSIFGDRLPIYYDPAAVRAEAPYVDAIAINYNVDSPEGWIAPYFFDGLRQLTGAKPVLVSEWFYAAHENRTGNRNNGHLMTVDDAGAARAPARRRAARAFAGHARARRPRLVPVLRLSAGRPRRSRGLRFRPRRHRRTGPTSGWSRRSAAANRAAAGDSRGGARAGARRLATFAIPAAAIDPRHRSLDRLAEARVAAAAAAAAPGDVRSARPISPGARPAWRSPRSARIITIPTCWPMTALFR